ncbi:RNA polymerase factor sigma-54 [Halobacillus mangrovi]|uniref:RNA polymerase sigma-54 factor n=1 Tax=Halobacillus mangrovi TaxID=402384 RepID=A0A1W5ZR48_9BACI|nr:RNA polymerase factor sigma-54 [Halobacillus mangrovi]ARI75761.1 RNA polymerase sigma-54 factor [Halobacillus mangrovi]
MKLELTQKQTTGLFMTTEVRQAISLLQYSAMDVWDYVQEEMLNNPLLAVEERGFSESYSSRSRNQAGEAMNNVVEFYPGHEKGWREKLFDQIKWQLNSKEDYEVMQYLILNLNERGFLPIEVNEISGSLNVSSSSVTDNLQHLKDYESRGLGSSGTRDYLIYQIKQQFPEEGLLMQLVAYYLDDIANRRWNQLSKQLSVSQADIKQAFTLLKKLRPHPYIDSIMQPVKYMVADIIVKKEGTDYLLTDSNSPFSSIHIDSSYASLKKDAKAESFLNDCYKNANWLIRSIEQRRQTILKVAKVIVKEQIAFLEGGPLHPLTYKQVAEQIDMHESTVSRAVSNKVMQTSRGVFEMKYFFTTGLSQNDSTISSTQVKNHIQGLIDQENKSKPLSDQKLAQVLKKDYGVEISRRTVAKYRESIQIPSSSKRKE